jgi:hypothetical protein
VRILLKLWDFISSLLCPIYIRSFVSYWLVHFGQSYTVESHFFPMSLVLSERCVFNTHVSWLKSWKLASECHGRLPIMLITSLMKLQSWLWNWWLFDHWFDLLFVGHNHFIVESFSSSLFLLNPLFHESMVKLIHFILVSLKIF